MGEILREGEYRDRECQFHEIPGIIFYTSYLKLLYSKNKNNIVNLILIPFRFPFSLSKFKKCGQRGLLDVNAKSVY